MLLNIPPTLPCKIGKFALINHITKLKKRENTFWLKEIDSQAIQQSIANMDKAYQHFFKGGGFPKFKSRHHSRQSFQYPKRVKVEGNKVFLPKVGWVKCKDLRSDVNGKIKTVTICYEAYQYHASILFDIDTILNRVITQQGWGLFFELLEYKLQERGGQLIKVDPKYTSQECNECHHVSKDNRQSQSKFVCISYGMTSNADTNAAKNIRDRGIHGSNASLKIAI